MPAPDACPVPTEFAQLIRRVQAGDDGAMTLLSERYGPAMRRTAGELIGRSLQSHLDSEDLVQSVQLVLWLGLRAGKFSFTTPQNLLALAKTLLKRRVARYCRDTRPLVNATMEGSIGDTLVDALLFPMSHEEDPQQSTEVSDLVENFVGRLGDLDRRLVCLRLEGYSTADVARRLSMDAGFLRVRLTRLRKRFADFREKLSQSPTALSDTMHG